jgi:putative hydrolase of the HAD superfamily
VVVFDVGGVLSGPPFAPLDAYCASLGITASMEAYFRGDPDFAALEIGALDLRSWFSRFLKRVESEHGTRLEVVEVATALRAARALRPEMIALVTELMRSHRIAVLTNNAAANDEYLVEMFQGGAPGGLPTGAVELICNSAALGVRKPDPAIYVELLRLLDCPAADVVFVDDFTENLPPARALGIRTILFTDPAQCRSDLAALGARIDPVAARS